MPIAVLADDEPLMRAALQERLAMLWPELEIRADAKDSLGAPRMVESLRPDVAFLDIRMPGMTGPTVNCPSWPSFARRRPRSSAGCHVRHFGG